MREGSGGSGSRVDVCGRRAHMKAPEAIERYGSLVVLPVVGLAMRILLRMSLEDCEGLWRSMNRERAPGLG